MAKGRGSGGNLPGAECWLSPSLGWDSEKGEPGFSVPHSVFFSATRGGDVLHYLTRAVTWTQ